MTQIEEVERAVRYINEEMYDACNDIERYDVCGFHGNGDSIRVKFMGNEIWSSDDDVRETFGPDAPYEPLYEFLLREAKKVLFLMSRIHEELK